MAFLAPASPFLGIGLAILGIGIQLAAAYFFPQKIKGPRASDLRAQTSKYGDQIARVHGSGRTAGAVIWLKNNKVDEHKDTERQGKFGPKVTTYTYTVDYAVAFAFNGPVKAIPRIWADDKLIYDHSAKSVHDGNGGGTVGGASIRIYLGTPDQKPDPNIAADPLIQQHFSGNVPAWPNIAYVVIRGLQLDEFGIRVPNTEAEVIKSGTDEYITVSPLGATGQMDSVGKILVTSSGDTGNRVVINQVPQFNILWSIDQVFEAYVPGADRSCGPYITKMGDIVMCPFAQGGSFVLSNLAAFFIDPAGGGVKQVVYGPTAGLLALGSMADISISGVDYLWVLMGSKLWALRFGLADPGLTGGLGIPGVPGSETDPTEMSWSSMGAVDISSGFNFLDFGCPFSAGPELLYAIRSSDFQIFTFPWLNGDSMPVAVSPPGISGDAIQLAYIQDSDVVVIMTTTGVFVYDSDLENLLASNVGLWSNPPFINQSAGPFRIEVDEGQILIHPNEPTSQAGDFFIFDLTDLSLIQHINSVAVGYTGISSPQWFIVNSDFDLIFGWGVVGWWLPRVSGNEISLAEVVSAECTAVGLDHDTTGLLGNVKGYVSRDGGPPRGVIEDLQRVKFFDFTQSNGTTKFFMRTSLATRDLRIPEDVGFAPGFQSQSDDNPKFIEREEYSDVKEIPKRVVLDYMSYDADYRESSQSVAAPESSTEADLPLQFQTSLVMDDDEAAQAADILLNEAQDASTVYSTGVGPKFLELHPGDVAHLDLEDEDRTVNAALLRMEGETIINLEMQLRTTIYTSDAVGMPTPNNPQSLLNRARVAPVFIDGHLMRAIDDGDEFYLGVYLAEQGDFTTATIYKSTDLGTTYNPWVGFDACLFRTVGQNILQDVPHPEAWDYASSLRMFLISTTGVVTIPSSVTEEQLLADAELNLFAVRAGNTNEWEYIQAAEIYQDTDGLWVMSRLLRGRKGTDFAIGYHAMGDAVIYCDIHSLVRPPDGEMGLTRMYATIASSTQFTDQYAITFTNRAKGLRPWAPWGVTGTRDGSGNLTIDWFRRDRLGQEWPEGGPEDPPMSETTEAYKVFIYSESAGILRTIDTTTSEASYSAAEQTTDFGAPVPVGELSIGVVQVSSIFGDGVERLATI